MNLFKLFFFIYITKKLVFVVQNANAHCPMMRKKRKKTSTIDFLGGDGDGEEILDTPVVGGVKENEIVTHASCPSSSFCRCYNDACTGTGQPQWLQQE